MPSKDMTEFAKRWHQIRRDQRRLEEPFIVDLLESSSSDSVHEILDGLTDEAISAVSFHLQNSHIDYWADIRYHNCQYDFESGSPEESARRIRFAATISTILSLTQ